MFRFARPELIIYVLPVLACVLAGKYVGRFVNFCIMLAVFQIGLFILASTNSGELRPRFLVPVIFIWPPISAGQFVPPLLFVVVAIIVYAQNKGLPRVKFSVRAGNSRGEGLELRCRLKMSSLAID